MRCPAGHIMKQRRDLRNCKDRVDSVVRVCDRCEREGLGRGFYYCTGRCDFDLCGQCYSRGLSSGGAQSTSPEGADAAHPEVWRC